MKTVYIPKGETVHYESLTTAVSYTHLTLPTKQVV